MPRPILVLAMSGAALGGCATQGPEAASLTTQTNAAGSHSAHPSWAARAGEPEQPATEAEPESKTSLTVEGYRFAVPRGWTFQLPDGWRAGPAPEAARLGELHIGEPPVIAVISMTEEETDQIVGRWAEPFGRAGGELAMTSEIRPFKGRTVYLVQIEGTPVGGGGEQPEPGRVLQGAIIDEPSVGKVLIITMKGPADRMHELRDDFVAMVESIRTE